MRALTLACLLLIACSSPIDDEAPIAHAPTAESAAPPEEPEPGTLVMSTNTGARCAWTIDGVAEGAAVSLYAEVQPGTHEISCLRTTDSKVATTTASVSAGETVEIELVFPGTP